MFEGAAGELRARLLSIGARGRNVLVGGRPQVLWEGLAELRADTPSKARGAEGERGRPPPSSNTQCPITPGTRQARPTKIVTFPRDKAEKSPQNQHVLSYNPNPLIPITRALGVIGHYVLLGLVPGVVVGGGVVEFVEATIASPQPGMVPVAWCVWLAWYQAFSRAASVGMVARIVAAGCG